MPLRDSPHPALATPAIRVLSQAHLHSSAPGPPLCRTTSLHPKPGPSAVPPRTLILSKSPSCYPCSCANLFLSNCCLSHLAALSTSTFSFVVFSWFPAFFPLLPALTDSMPQPIPRPFCFLNHGWKTSITQLVNLPEIYWADCQLAPWNRGKQLRHNACNNHPAEH